MARRKERSKTGCTSCLHRKIKCDEQRPTCRQCIKSEIKCLWDSSSRIHVQKARRRCKATAYYSTTSPESSCPSDDTAFTEQIQPLSYDYTLPEGAISEGNYAALSFTAKRDAGRPPDAAHAWYIDSTLELPDPLSSNVYPPFLPCANSIRLSPRDKLYLQYFPTSSLVKVLGKKYIWSNFRYICQNKASEEAMVMYAVMALSASEMNQNLGLANTHDEGRLYYRLALQRIADAVSNLTCESNNMEAVLGALFLVIAYEWRFGSSISRLQTHTQGLLTCLDVFFQFTERGSIVSTDLTTCPSFTPFCAQILLWTLYIESSCIRGNLSFELMDYLQRFRGESHLHSLFTFARHSYLFINGEQYPAEQHQDDLENYSPLELIHQDYLFRYRIWRLSQRRGEPVQSEWETLWREMNIIRKGYHDLFQLQKSPPKAFRHRRAFVTLCEGLAGYYCNILLICRLSHYPVIPIESRNQALSELLDICYTIHEWYPVDPTLGFAWHLLIAGLETKDRIHRQWAYDRLKDLGGGWNTCKWAGDMLRLMHDPEDKAGPPENKDAFLEFIQPIA